MTQKLISSILIIIFLFLLYFSFFLPTSHSIKLTKWYSPDKKRQLEISLTNIKLNKIKMNIEKIYTIPEDYEIIKTKISENLQRIAILLKTPENKYLVVVDGKEGKKYDNVYYPTFSPDSKNFAYVAGESGKEFVVFNNQEGKKYEYVSSLIFSPDSKNFAYRVGENCNYKYGDYYCSKYFVVFNNKEGKKYDDISRFSLIFSPDSKNFAYIAKESGKYFVVFNNKEGKKYDNVEYSKFRFPTFSPDSKNFAYIAEESGKYFVVFNNQEGKKYDNVYDLTFSPDSKNFAYVAEESGKEFVVFNNKERKKYNKIFYHDSFPPYLLNNNLIYFARENNDILKIILEF